MKKLLLMLLLALPLKAANPNIPLYVHWDGTIAAPTQFLSAVFLAGGGITMTDNGTNMTISAAGGGMSTTNFVLTMGGDLTNLVYSLGANSTNFTLLSLAQSSNYTWSVSNTLSSSMFSLGSSNALLNASSNYTWSVSNSSYLYATAVSNYAYTASNSMYANLYTLRTTNDLTVGASNVVINMDVPGLEIYVTNQMTFTNFTGLVSGTTKTKAVWLVVTAGGPHAITYPSDGASYGLYWATNCLPQANRPYTSVTNGQTYVLSLTSRGTNVYAAMTEWK
jgi:hypothetical protein